jgi:tetratricopeptide (TPR) repeat protein
MGIASFKLGDFEDALMAYQKAEELNPDHAQLKYNMGLAEFKQENIMKAKEYF